MQESLKLISIMKKILFLTLLFLFFACKKEAENECICTNEPIIESLEMDYSYGLNLLGYEAIFIQLSFLYSDGYSNFGAENSEIPESNCWIQLYKKENDIFHSYISDFDNYSSLSIPKAEIGKATLKQPILHESFNKYEGQITIDLEYYSCNPICSGDTIKYTVQVMDRDSLMSNIIEIEEIISIDL
jgi:hypothetical protein